MRSANLGATIAVIATLPFSTIVATAAKPLVIVSFTRATIVTAADGTARLARLRDNVALTGGTSIRYTISAEDRGAEAARELALTVPIPTGTTFVAQSVHGPGGHAEYSLDGKTFAARPMVHVPAGGADVLEPADPARYVMIRWIKDSPLRARSTSAFSYDVRVK